VTTHRRFLAARLAYVAIVLIATLSQLDFSPNLADAAARLQRALVPSLGWRDAVDGLRNAVLFAGLGVVWVTTSFTGNIPREIRVATLTSLLLSATVEACQVFSPVRDASLIDVTTNTLGGLGGAVAAALVLIALRDSRNRRSYLGVPMLILAGPYVAAVLCEALAPLFQSEPLEMGPGGPVAHFIALWHASGADWSAVDFWDVPLYAAAGFLAVALLREWRGAGRSYWKPVAAIAAVTIAAAHTSHGFISLSIHWGGALVDAVSTALGAWAAERWLGELTQRYRGAARARVVIASYVALLFVWGWRPFVPELSAAAISKQLDPGAFIPLAGLASRVDAFSALHVVQQALLYLPLGALLAVWPLRLAGPWSNAWPGVAAAAIIEVGHIVIAGRTFDVTNALLACAGLMTGWTVVRRSGYRAYGASWVPGG
jgi:VanZ family protein